MASSVLLPQPDGPTRPTTSPASSCTSSPSRARTSPRRDRQSFLTPRRATSVSVAERGSVTGASSCIAPSAGITPQVQRVNAGIRERYLSRPPPAPDGSTSATIGLPSRGSASAAATASSWRDDQHPKTPSHHGA